MRGDGEGLGKSEEEFGYRDILGFYSVLPFKESEWLLFETSNSCPFHGEQILKYT